MESLPKLAGEQFLLVSPGRAQLAGQLLDQYAAARVQAWYHDLYPLSEAKQFAMDSERAIEFLASSDLPEKTYDAVFMPIMKRGEAELTRDLMQQAHQRIAMGGYLYVSVDNPNDTWLHEQMKNIFDKVTCQHHPQGRAYWGRKNAPLKRIRNFDCQFLYKDQDKIITALTRPGVFSHRSLDGGARQLMNSVEVGPDDHVIDYGCGCGAVAFACAAQTSGQVFAVDGNARAIECTQKGAELNGFKNIVPIWNSDGQFSLPVPADVALANPPYFGDQKIWQHFVDACLRNLRIGGSLLIVTKQPSWYEEYLETQLENLSIAPAGHYFIVHGWKS
jgi:16S rRNA G1207 methylase RsmC